MKVLQQPARERCRPVLDGRLELFTDDFLIEKLEGARLRLHEPRQAGIVLLAFVSEDGIRWKAGSGVGTVAGRTVRLRFVLKDADLYSVRFR